MENTVTPSNAGMRYGLFMGMALITFDLILYVLDMKDPAGKNPVQYLSCRMGRGGRGMAIKRVVQVKKLVKFMGAWRLVIVHAPRLHNEVTWTVQTHSSTVLPRPAIFSRAAPTASMTIQLPRWS